MIQDRSSEGPYSHEGNCSNPKCDACSYHRGYAEGRKSAEKDFQELLRLANSFISKVDEGRAYWVVKRKFDAWKKARGLA